MKKFTSLNRYATQGILSVGMLALLSGCVDDKYDLDNFDSTMQVQVKDLTIPLNLAPVSFGSLVDLDSDLIDDSTGEYVLRTSGDFESDPIKIDDIHAKTSATNEPTVINLPAVVPGYSFDVPVNETFDFEYDYDEVSSYIRSITSAKVNFDITVKVTTNADIALHNVKVQMPAGTRGKLDGNLKYTEEADHTIVIEELPKNNFGEFTFTYVIDYINLAEAGAILSVVEPYSEDALGSFHFHNAIVFVSAEIEGLSESYNEDLTIDIEFGDIYVEAIAGKLMINNINTTAQLEDLPKELTNRSTRIGLQDPKIYLTISEAMERNEGIVATAGVSIKQIRHDEAYFEPESARNLTLDPGTVLSITGNGNDHNFVFGNITNDPTNGQYNLENVEYLVYGKGMPDALEIEFTNPTFTANEDHMFELGGSKIDPFTGTYEFEAPLAFTSGSQVVFSQEQDGWGISEDDNMDITRFDITASVKSDIPVGVNFHAYPIQIDANGRKFVNRNVKLTCDPIPPMADIADYKIAIEGEIKQIEGMEYEVTINSNGNSEVLSPNQSLTFSNIRVTVSGNYTINSNDDEDDE